MAAKPVIVGVDGSEESLLAAEWAAMEAGRHGLPLHIVSAPARVPWMNAASAGPIIGSAQHVLLEHARGPVAVVPSGD